jgi:hypothetical protein
MWSNSWITVATTAVSSAKVAVVDSGKIGRSAAYSRYNNGPRTLPWVHLLWLRTVLYTRFQPLRGSVWYANRILGQGNDSEGETVLTCIGVPMPYFVQCLRDVWKCCRTVLLIFESFVYPLYDSMCQFYCGVFCLKPNWWSDDWVLIHYFQTLGGAF